MLRTRSILLRHLALPYQGGELHPDICQASGGGSSTTLPGFLLRARIVSFCLDDQRLLAFAQLA
jgi:hypothetical protein